MSAKSPCPGCGQPLSRPTVVSVLTGAGLLERKAVCPDCCKRSVTIVALDQGQETRTVLAPWAHHFRKLAKAYELVKTALSQGQAEGLRQAAGILESGRAVSVEVVGAPKRTPAILEDLSRRKTEERLRDVTPSILRTQGLTMTQSLPRRLETLTTGHGLSRCERKILHALIQRGKPTSDAQLVILSGYRPTGGTAGAFAALRAAEFIVGPGSANEVTPDGLEAAGHVEPLPRGQDLLDHWCRKVGKCAGAILRVLAAEYPREVPLEELLEVTGYRETGGTAGAMALLRKLDLIKGFRATDELMEGIRG